ncbi:MAG: hypothetical protein HXX20_11470 [Chloroflexi bacterium]|nr:hypothetical protein [Chloroflexota bacterium]
MLVRFLKRCLLLLLVIFLFVFGLTTLVACGTKSETPLNTRVSVTTAAVNAAITQVDIKQTGYQTSMSVAGDNVITPSGGVARANATVPPLTNAESAGAIIIPPQLAPTDSALVEPFQEFVEAQWPISMSSGSTTRIKVSFIRTSFSNQSYNPTIEIAGQTAIIAAPMTVAGTPGVPINKAFPQEDGFITANLSSLGFDIKATSPIIIYSLNQPIITWEWEIKPKNGQDNNQIGKQTLSVDINAFWKSKEIPNAVIRERQVWSHSFVTEVYPFFLSTTQLIAFGGTIVLGFIFSLVRSAITASNSNERKK